MVSRSIKLLLLATLLAWATGAAQFIHERIEHADGDEPSAVAVDSAPSTADSSDPPKAPAHHGHDDCPTCQLLAHMKAAPVAPPPPICVHLPTCELAIIWQESVLTADPIPFAPIRGPPIAA
jgi:hypothetical protein